MLCQMHFRQTFWFHYTHSTKPKKGRKGDNIWWWGQMLVRLMVTLVKQRDERFAAKSLDGKWSPGRLLPTTAYRLNPTLPITGCTLPITASRGTGGLYCFLVHSGIFSVRHGGLDFKGVEHFFLYSYWEQINSYLTLRCSKPTNGWFRPEEERE